MNTKIIYAAIALLIIIGIVFLATHKNSATFVQQSTTVLANQNNTNSTKVLFENTQYFPYAYLVFPGQLSQQAQSAMDGFNMSVINLTNGSNSIKISVIGTTSSTNFVLKPGYKLYIIETSFGDDGYHFDSSLGDDGFVVVDPQGYLA